MLVALVIYICRAFADAPRLSASYIPAMRVDPIVSLRYKSIMAPTKCLSSPRRNFALLELIRLRTAVPEPARINNAKKKNQRLRCRVLYSRCGRIANDRCAALKEG